MHVNLVLLFLVLVIAASVSEGNAAVIYSQTDPARPTAGFSSVDIPTIGQKLADNFILATDEPTFARSLRVIGGYGMQITEPSQFPDDNFRVVFFEDDNGTPGTLLTGGDFRVGAAYKREATKGPLLNGFRLPVEYFIDLGDGLLLEPDVVYWMTVTNTPEARNSWSWASTFGEFDTVAAATMDDLSSASWNVAASGGMFFEINDANVPEPTSTSILLIFGACAFGLQRAAIWHRVGTHPRIYCRFLS